METDKTRFIQVGEDGDYDEGSFLRDVAGNNNETLPSFFTDGCRLINAKSIAVLCIIVLGLLLIHLTHFWAKMSFRNYMGGGAEDNPYCLLLMTFHRPMIVVGYFIWFGALFFVIKRIAMVVMRGLVIGGKEQYYNKYSIIVTSLIVFLFVLTVVAAFVEANYHTASDAYTYWIKELWI